MRYLHLTLSMLLLCGLSPIPALASKKASPPPHIVLITLDAANWSFLGAHGDPVAQTPNLDALARESVTFARAYTPASWTAPALLSLFTSTSPVVHGVEFFDLRPPENLPDLAEMLTAAGYDAPALCPLLAGTNYQYLGFTDVPAEVTGRFPRERTLRWLNLPHTKPFFLWYHDPAGQMPLHYSEGWHRTVLGPRPAGQSEVVKAAMLRPTVLRNEYPLTSADRQEILLLYRAAVREADAFVGKLMHGLAEGGMLDNTIVVLTAAHGTEMFENGWFGDTSSSLDGSLRTERTHIPLFWRLPRGRHAGRVNEALVDLLDVAPTLLKQAGVRAPRSFSGIALDSAFSKPFDGGKKLLFGVTVPGGANVLPEWRGHRVWSIRNEDKVAYKDVYQSQRVSSACFSFGWDPGELHPADPESWGTQGMLFKLQNWTRTERSQRAALELENGPSAESHPVGYAGWLRGRLFAARGDRKNALREYKIALSQVSAGPPSPMIPMLRDSIAAVE